MAQSVSEFLQTSLESGESVDQAMSLTQTIALDITGMKCAGCVKAVEKALTQHSGVYSATVNLATEIATVQYEPKQVNPQDLAESLTDAGFPAQPRLPLGEQSATQSAPSFDIQARRQQEARQQRLRLVTAMGLLLLSTLGHLQQLGGISIPALNNIWLHCGLATLALLFPGRAMLIDGWRGLQRNAPNMNTLVSLGTLTAYCTSLVALLVPQLGWDCFFDEPVMLVGFILLGRTLEQQARNRAATAFQALLTLQPKTARLIKAGHGNEAVDEEFNSSLQTAIDIPAEAVRVGEWLQVLAGDKIPVDGEIIAGQSTVDESMLTGEAMPVLKQPGDRVAAGTLSQSGAIAIRATRTGRDTTLAQIIQLVETAQTRKAPIQKLVDTVAGYFTYGVVAIAVLTFLFWYFFGTQIWPTGALTMGHGSWGSGHSVMNHLFTPVAAAPSLHHPMRTPTPLLLSLKLAIAVLVVACPCALGLATPTAILVGSGIGAERGLLIRGSDVLERVHRLDTIVLDKTGTLTTGTPTLTDCLVLDETSPVSPSDLLRLAATVESGTRHPLAIAICAAAQQQQLSLLPAQEFVTAPGLGVAAIVQSNAPASVLPTESESSNLEQGIGQSVILGTVAWLAQNQIQVPQTGLDQAESLGSAGKTVVFVAVAGSVVGLLAATDQLRPDGATTVAALKQLGLNVILLTGDRRETAAAIAQSLQIAPQNLLAETPPAGKAATIAQLQTKGHRVAMVGDGINDAPALAQADVGIALHSGADLATETSDIILMRDRLSDVIEAIRLSRATFNKIQQNLGWAIGYNLIGIPLAAGLLLPMFSISLSPAAAGVMMALSSVSVVTNSLLLYLTFPACKSQENS